MLINKNVCNKLILKYIIVKKQARNASKSMSACFIILVSKRWLHFHTVNENKTTTHRKTNEFTRAASVVCKGPCRVIVRSLTPPNLARKKCYTIHPPPHEYMEKGKLYKIKNENIPFVVSPLSLLWGFRLYRSDMAYFM